MRGGGGRVWNLLKTPGGEGGGGVRLKQPGGACARGGGGRGQTGNDEVIAKVRERREAGGQEE